ncbi:MAG: FAD-dependent oxidoreductase [Candidatus Hatepunaea meridiana]|nr:FAD-dependent oxidoreductase [Candidatus Hatepunaea meridiana]
MAKQLIFTPNRCVDCKNCEMACSFVHTRDFTKLAMPRVQAFTFKEDIKAVSVCQQCEDAPCQKVCPTGALVRNPATGAIERTDSCILCKSCTLACPYGNIHFDPVYDEIVKCDFCGGDPACAKVCPTRALVWAEEPAPDIKQDAEIERVFTEEEARYSANRCLDCADCSECGECVKACPADAIHFDMQPEEIKIEANSVIVSTGFKLFDAHLKTNYGYGKYPNVVTAMQMDRLVSPTKPYNRTMRPSDGKAPDNIAFVLCTGSRDCTIGNPLCSRVCCMYSIKQAQLLMGSLPLADITIYYIDIRAFGKGYEEFYQQAKEMGVYFVKGRVAKIEPVEDGNLSVFYEDIDGGSGQQQMEHDLVVLSIGLLPNMDALNLFKNGDRLEADAYSYVKEINEDIEPTRTSIDGVFVAGTTSAARDIPDSILHAGAAAAQAAGYIHQLKASR